MLRASAIRRASAEIDIIRAEHIYCRLFTFRRYSKRPIRDTAAMRAAAGFAFILYFDDDEMPIGARYRLSRAAGSRGMPGIDFAMPR